MAHRGRAQRFVHHAYRHKAREADWHWRLPGCICDKERPLGTCSLRTMLRETQHQQGSRSHGCGLTRDDLAHDGARRSLTEKEGCTCWGGPGLRGGTKRDNGRTCRRCCACNGRARGPKTSVAQWVCRSQCAIGCGSEGCAVRTVGGGLHLQRDAAHVHSKKGLLVHIVLGFVADLE